MTSGSNVEPKEAWGGNWATRVSRAAKMIGPATDWKPVATMVSNQPRRVERLYGPTCSQQNAIVSRVEDEGNNASSLIECSVALVSGWVEEVSCAPSAPRAARALCPPTRTASAANVAERARSRAVRWRPRRRLQELRREDWRAVSPRASATGSRAAAGLRAALRRRPPAGSSCARLPSWGHLALCPSAEFDSLPQQTRSCKGVLRPVGGQ